MYITDVLAQENKKKWRLIASILKTPQNQVYIIILQMLAFSNASTERFVYFVLNTKMV